MEASRQTQIARTLAVQLLITLLGLAGIFYDRTIGLAVAAGGALCWMPNALAAAVVFRERRAQSLNEEKRRMWRAEAIRWLGMLAGLGLILGIFPEIEPFPLFVAFATALVLPVILTRT